MLMAEATPTAAQWGNWFLVTTCLLSAMGNVALVVALFRKNKVEPQPLIVKGATEFSRREELEGVKKALKDAEVAASINRKTIYERIDGMKRDVGAKVDELEKSVAGLDRETKNQNAWLERIDAKIDRMQSRI